MSGHGSEPFQLTRNESAPPLVRTSLRLPDRREGKVRDIYTLPASGDDPGGLVLIATDRISAFDVVLPSPIPGKGQVLNRVAAWWLRWIEGQGLCRTHLVSTDEAQIPDEAFVGEGSTPREALQDRVCIGRACRVIPIECVVRGYLEGSGWREYQASGAVCGIPLPDGLRRCDRLPTPIFTPATKAEVGHDENITFEQACEMVGAERMRWLRDRSIEIYQAANEYAAGRGLILADTKFEFGIPIDAQGRPVQDEPILIDEALTPDSSRYWDVGDYEPGRAQASFDKQFVRDYLESMVERGEWNKHAPGPLLPDEIVQRTRDRYDEAERRICRSGD